MQVRAPLSSIFSANHRSASCALAETCARETGTLDYLHAVNLQLLRALNEAEHHLSHAELSAFFKGSTEGMNALFQEMAGYTRLPAEGLVEPPFAGAGNVGENRLAGGELSEARAVELAKGYLAGYHITEAHCTGEVRIGEAMLYHIVLSDGETQFDAAIAKKDGSLVSFSAQGACGRQEFDLSACEGLAREFLSKAGIKNVEAVRCGRPNRAAWRSSRSCPCRRACGCIPTSSACGCARAAAASWGWTLSCIVSTTTNAQ